MLLLLVNEALVHVAVVRNDKKIEQPANTLKIDQRSSDSSGVGSRNRSADTS